MLLAKGVLSVDRGRQAGEDRVEDRDDPVAGGLQNRPAGLAHGSVQDLVMSSESCGHLVPVLFPEPRAPFDVGEEEGLHRIEKYRKRL
jgi:hypothetical protein